MSGESDLKPAREGAVLDGAMRNLDVLRAFAVGCVFFAHVLKHVMGVKDFFEVSIDDLGRMGVLIFFVHTSLVLLMSLDRITGNRPWISFYVRRLFRIYPLCAFLILITLVFQIPPSPDTSYHWIGIGQILSNLSLTDNLTDSQLLSAPLWSLSYEVQMYLVLPYIHSVLAANQSVGAAFTVWGCAALLRTTLLLLGIDVRIIHFLPCFLSGALAYRICQQVIRPRLSSFLWPPMIVLLSALYLSMSILMPTSWVARDYILCLCIGLAIPYFNDVKEGAAAKICRTIATYSYSIYLLHTPAIWLAFVYVSAASPIRWFTFGVLSVVVPYLSYHLLEAPLVAVGKRIARRIAEQTG